MSSQTSNESTPDLLMRAAGWLAAPEGETRASTVSLIQGLVRSVKGLQKVCAMNGLDTGLAALRGTVPETKGNPK